MQTYIKFLEKASSREKKFSPSVLAHSFRPFVRFVRDMEGFDVDI